ncbi:hypothetical protein lerEdw1_010899 [Lerista edwardsae]|nr:hypothetical protein lerEdw1_010899 [Lerista edwardsae]
MDYKRMCWLWIVALCPHPGLQADSREQPSPTEQIPATSEGISNSTTEESRTDSIPVTENGTDPTSRSQGSFTTPGLPFPQSSPEDEMSSPAPKHRSSAVFWAPPLVAVVLLVGLFLMYRRKRGRESRSRVASINSSSARPADFRGDAVDDESFIPCDPQRSKGPPELSQPEDLDFSTRTGLDVPHFQASPGLNAVWPEHF